MLHVFCNRQGSRTSAFPALKILLLVDNNVAEVKALEQYIYIYIYSTKHGAPDCLR